MRTTRGLRVVCFRKRYYIFYGHRDSYPDGLGKEIVAEIPTDAAKYQEWLDVQRKLAEEWEALYEDFLSIKPGNVITNNLPDFIRLEFPSSLAPLSCPLTEWIYTVDLDRETFSVNNGAHFKLDRVPHVDWINSLADGRLGDKIILPGVVPMEAVTNLVIEHTDQSCDVSKTMGDLAISETPAPLHRMVVPKDVRDIPWRQRHGPILRKLMFHFWSSAKEDSLAASLLQLKPEDLPFREIAYAALSLAAGGKNVKVVPDEDLSANGVFGFICEKWKYEADSEFVSSLASGAHLQGSPPGSSPNASTYWLDDVLVVLTTHLYRPGAADRGIAQIIRYCEENHATERVDAVLISVEHVVLVHLTPGRNIQRTAIMPLFNIKNHLSMSVNDRYAKPYLEKLAAKEESFMKKEAKKQRKANQERLLRNEGIKLRYRDDDGHEDELDGEEDSPLCATQVEGDLHSTFYALVHLFEAAACKRMPPARATDGVLPNEIYTQIIKLATDTGTRESLVKVSRTFRRICQEDHMFAEGLIFEPSEACQSCNDAHILPSEFKKYDVAIGSQSLVKCARAGGFVDMGFLGESWKVLVGTEYSKRSLLEEVAFRFTEV